MTPPRIDRRRFLQGALGAGAALAAAPWLGACAGGARLFGREPAVFRHGVASGDPLADRVILWTRAEPDALRPAEPVEVEWWVAQDPGLRRVVRSGRAASDPARDHTLKLDVEGLEPGATWYYRFRARGERSAVGRTRTLPTGSAEHLRLAFFSCANVAWGWFNPYAAAARRADLDLVLHLGDYLYEHPFEPKDDAPPAARVPEPAHELVSLADYRTRHAQYKRDPDLQALHRQHAMIAVWDDHESADDAWRGGAQNHQPETEGAWSARRAAAVQAWHEWMPVREQPPAADGAPRIYRSFRFGDLAEITMLDTRLHGRDLQAKGGSDWRVIQDRRRQLLGQDQERWLFERLAGAQREGVRWKLLGQQVMLGQLRTPDGSVRSPDKWDGYEGARQRLFARLSRGRIEDVVVLTGDIHSSWALDLAPDPFDLRRYDPRTGRGALAVELIGPAVCSSRIADLEKAAALARDALARHPHLRWCDLTQRGYVTLDVTPERVQGDWWHVPSVDVRSPEERFARGFATRAGAAHLVEAKQPAPPRPGARGLAP